MSEGHTSPTADTPVTTTENNAAPVPADVRAHADHHAQTPSYGLKEQDSVQRLTPRPTFMEHLADSRDAQFRLHRRDSSELEQYFVRGDPRDKGFGQNVDPGLANMLD